MRSWSLKSKSKSTLFSIDYPPSKQNESQLGSIAIWIMAIPFMQFRKGNSKNPIVASIKFSQPNYLRFRERIPLRYCGVCREIQLAVVE